MRHDNSWFLLRYTENNMPKPLLILQDALTEFTPQTFKHRIFMPKNDTFRAIATQCDKISKNKVQTEQFQIPTDIQVKTGCRYDVGQLSYRG